MNDACRFCPGGSWFASPILAGIISIGIFIVIRRFILEQVTNLILDKIYVVFFLFKPDQLKVGLRWLPVFYSVTIMINTFSIFLSAPPREFRCFRIFCE